MGLRLQKFFAVTLLLTFVFTLPVALLTTLFAGLTIGIALFITGYLILLPLTVFLGRASGEYPFTEVFEATVENRPIKRDGGESSDDPLKMLQHRFAQGEIDHEEFQHRVEQLLASEQALDDHRPPETVAGDKDEIENGQEIED